MAASKTTASRRRASSRAVPNSICGLRLSSAYVSLRGTQGVHVVPRAVGRRWGDTTAVTIAHAKLVYFCKYTVHDSSYGITLWLNTRNTAMFSAGVRHTPLGARCAHQRATTRKTFPSPNCVQEQGSDALSDQVCAPLACGSIRAAGTAPCQCVTVQTLTPNLRIRLCTKPELEYRSYWRSNVYCWDHMSPCHNLETGRQRSVRG